MKNLLENIILESLDEIKADKLLAKVLESENLSGEFYLIAIGKAACPMAKAADDILGDRIIKGLVVTKKGQSEKINNFKIIEAGHPYPDENSLLAGKEIFKIASSLKRNEQILLLVSGGASALAVFPRPPVSLQEFRNVTRKLQLAGADIIELNTVRKHLSLIKGGQLAILAEPGRIYGYLLSDVPGDRMDTIGSGLAVLDKTTSKAAQNILDQYDIDAGDAVEKALIKETPEILRNAVMKIIGNNELLCQIVAEKIMKNGYIPWLLTTDMQGEASQYARMIPDIVSSARSRQSKINLPCIAICGGETTVKVTGSGRGGRNQEMALAAAIQIKNLEKVTVACIASDGIDGNSEYAGAIVDTNSYDRMLSAGINPEAYLHNNDSTSALSRIDAVIYTGNTNTNLNDILLVLIEK
jgi:hydroxypyruvate reductase